MNNRFQGRHQPGGSPRERLQTLDTEDEFRRRAAAADVVAVQAGAAVSIISEQVFTTTGVYVPSATMKYAYALITHGGGGGGGADTNGTNGTVGVGGGGGAGGTRWGIFTRAQILAAIPAGASGLTVTIGAAGTAGSNTGGNGGNGGASSFGSLLTGTAGGTGGFGSGTSAATTSTGFGAAGGTSGSGGVSGVSGGGGGNGIGFSVDGTTDVVAGIGGTGGGSYWGSGAKGSAAVASNLATNAVSVGEDAAARGAGGGGAVCLATGAGQIGGLGREGIVVVREYA